MSAAERDTRRDFVGRVTGAVGFFAAGLGSAPEKEPPPGNEVSPPEDLMREHGVLKRVMMIYEEILRRIEVSEDFPPEALTEAARVIRTFVEDYHEKLEEDHLFPRFERAHRLTDLVSVLRAQHQAGRRVTDLVLAAAPQRDGASRQRVVSALRSFNRMYRPHEAREDTVLFPAFRGIVGAHEFDALGEEFERREDQLFGEDGFERVVDQVAGIEKRLGIYELGQFTPKA